MIAFETKELAQIAVETAPKKASRSLADVLRLAKMAEHETGGAMRELSLAELGRVGGGQNVGNNI
jgi:hypothetical protein